MSDVSERVKLKILSCLDASAQVTTLVPAHNIFPMQVGADTSKPFLRYGPPTVIPYEDWCGSGVSIETTIHCFAVGESAAQKIAAAVQDALSGMTGIVDYNWIRTQFVQDPDEASVWNGMVTVQVTDR